MENGILELPGQIRQTINGNIDKWYGPYNSLAEAVAGVDESMRAKRTVGIITGGVISDYWWPGADLTITGLIKKVKESVNTTVAGLRLISNPLTDVIYQTTDYGGGQWYYDATDTTTADNTGTVLVSGTKRFKRIYLGKTVFVDWFGADKSGITDSYTAIQNAINSVGGNGVVKFGTGTYYLNTFGLGGLKLPTNAIGIIIEGEGISNTTIKCSATVPRVFDLNFPTDVNNVNLFSNITLRRFKVDANNITGLSIGPALSVISVGATSGGYTDINVSTTVGYLPNGRIAFPYTNAGTSKSQYRTYRLKSGSTTVIQVQLSGAETVLAGDIIQGGMRNHILIGMSYDNYYYNINVDGLTIQDIEIINVAPAEITTSAYADKAATKREAIYIQSGSSSVDFGLGGYAGQLYAKNILIERVKVYGGAIGFAVGGGQLTAALSNYYIDNIVFRDCFHNTFTIPTNYYSNVNFIIGNKSFGGRCLIERCTGYNAADVGVETDALVDVKVIGCDIYNSFNSGYFSVNYSIPRGLPGGNITALLSADITSAATSLSISSLPAVALNGYIMVDAEVMYYQAAGTTLTITRGIGGTTPAGHTSGAIVNFVETERQLTQYINCRYTNNALGNSGGSAWASITTPSGLPQSPIYIENCYYEKTTAFSLGSQRGEVVYGSGNVNYNIRGLVIKISGIDVISASSNNSGCFYFQNTVYDTANGINSPIPPAPIKLRDIDITVSGKLDNAALLARIELFVDAGNWFLDWDKIKVRQNLQSTASGGTQSTGIWLGTSASAFISGVINNYKYSANGANAPIAIFMNGGATYGRLFLDNIDLTEMKFGAASNNSNYKPWRINIANANFNGVYFGEVKHSLSVSSAAARKRLKRVVPITATYAVNLSEDYVPVNTLSSAITINLPSVEPGQTDYKTNYGYVLYIVDERFNAATNNITINPYSGEKINNSTSALVINTSGGFARLVSIPGGWINLK